MNAQDRNGENVLPITSPAEGDDDLRYEIVLAPELTDGRGAAAPESGERAACPGDFNAAKSEHPDARIVLRRDARVLADSSGEKTR